MKSLSSENLAEIIENSNKSIQKKWLAKVRAHIPKANAFDDDTVIDSLEKFLNEIAQVLRTHGSTIPWTETLKTARDHGATRVPLNYTVSDVTIEYSLIKETIIFEATQHGILSGNLFADLGRIGDAGLINAVEEFLKKTLLESERAARRMAEESKKQLHDFFMQAPEPMVIMSGPDHVFTVANEPYIRFIGLNPVGKKVREVFTEQEAGNFFSILDTVYRTGDPFVGKEMPFKKTGSLGPVSDHWINIGYYPARGNEGKIVGIHAFVYDVTDQVRARKSIEAAKTAVEHERKNLENLFRQTPEMICITKGPEHRFEFVNNAHIKTLGFSAAGKTVREAQPESVEVHGILDQVYRTGETLVLPEIGVTVTDRLRYFDITFAAHRNFNDDVDGTMLVATEITEQILNRESLKLQGRALELSMADAPLPDVLNVMTNLVELQAGGTLIASVLLADKEEKHLLHGAAPGLPDEYNAAVHGIAIGPNSGSCGSAAFFKKRTVVTDIMEDPLWADYKELAQLYGLRACWSVPILSSRQRLLGTFAFYSKVSRDPSGRELEIVSVAAQTTALIIERRLEIEERILAASEAERANAAKSAFLANMSHEIRTPLGAIMGFSDLARQPGATKDEISSYLGVVERNSAQVIRIIDDILDLAKVEAGRVELEVIEISFTAFLADFSSLAGFRARENGIVFGIKPESELPERICTDPTRLRQILTNAVGNAIKFTTKGSVTLHICFKSGLLEFGIADTGRGISDEQAQNLFQAFVQADVSTTRKFGGTGLGLVLTKRLCQLMGGDYYLQRSELGVGSKFAASIKVQVPAHSKMTSKNEISFESTVEQVAPIARGKLEGIKILLVEDSPDNQFLIRLILERQGADLDVASDGFAGVERAMTGGHDIILMDIQMPKMDGHEAMQTLRDRGYQKPVIALTAHAMKEETERAKRSGFTNFLSKPIHRETLVSMVNEVVRESRSRN